MHVGGAHSEPYFGLAFLNRLEFELLGCAPEVVVERGGTGRKVEVPLPVDRLRHVSCKFLANSLMEPVEVLPGLEFEVLATVMLMLALLR